MSNWEGRRVVIMDGELLEILLKEANPDCVIQIRWGEPVTEEVIYYEPRITVIRPDTP